MTGPIIRTMYAGPEALTRLTRGQYTGLMPTQVLAKDVPVLVIYAPGMPDFRAGDRVRHRESGEEVGVDGVYVDSFGTWCFVGYDTKRRAAWGWSRVEPEPEPEPWQDDNATSLARTLADFRDGEVGATAAVAALDDYIRRALGMAER